MVNILVIGDFHGKFPEKLLKQIKKEKFDLIISPGDYCGNSELGKLFFKYAYGTDKSLSDFIGKKKVKELERENFESGIKILKKLNSFGKPVIGVRGNWDPLNWQDIGQPNVKDQYTERFNEEIKKLKNIKIIDFKKYIFNEVNFIGYPRSSYPGFINRKREKRIIKKYGKEGIIKIKKTKEDNKKYFKKLNKLFSKKYPNIFISHNCPYHTKFDIIKKGPQKGKHYGSWLTKEIIKKLKPQLVICGHMHENIVKERVGKSLVVNAGAGYEGKAGIINIDFSKKNQEKIKVKFLR